MKASGQENASSVAHFAVENYAPSFLKLEGTSCDITMDLLQYSQTSENILGKGSTGIGKSALFLYSHSVYKGTYLATPVAVKVFYNRTDFEIELNNFK